VILWALASVGLTLVITQSSLFFPLRMWLASPWGASQPDMATPPELRSYRSRFLAVLFSCPMCFGWWAGAWWVLAGVRPSGVDGGLEAMLHPSALPIMKLAQEALAAAFASSLLSWFAYLAHRKLGGIDLLPKPPAPTWKRAEP
jgi:hypothetical protein